MFTNYVAFLKLYNKILELCYSLISSIFFLKIMMSTKTKNIERRNIQISGGSTYVISLPKKWIEKLKLKNGDSMQIVNNPNHTITLSADAKLEESSTYPEVKIKKTDSVESIKRKIISLYISGHNFIVLNSPRAKIETDVRSMVMKLIRTKFVGTEIIESDSESITIKVLSATPEMKLELAFNRMFKSTSNMFSETIHAIEKNDSEYAQEIIHMDDEIDRFSYYLTRNLVLALDDSNVLSALGLEKTSQAIGYKRIITCVEKIADHITATAQLAVDMDGKNISKIPKDILSTYQKTIELFEKTMALVSERNYSLAEKHAEEIEALIEETTKQTNSIKNNSEASGVYLSLIYQNRRILDYIMDVSEVVMNDTVDSVVSMKQIENTES